jgi:hypothetical protein
MLPIAAYHARSATEERARSALPRAPVRVPSETNARHAGSPRARRRVAAFLRSAADRLEPVTD